MLMILKIVAAALDSILLAAALLSRLFEQALGAVSRLAQLVPSCGSSTAGI
jgi:hypothetical protein